MIIEVNPDDESIPQKDLSETHRQTPHLYSWMRGSLRTVEIDTKLNEFISFELSVFPAQLSYFLKNSLNLNSLCACITLEVRKALPVASGAQYTVNHVYRTG